MLYICLGMINVFELLGNLMPVRKKGRPCNAKKALEREDDLDVDALRPGDWKRTPLRHPEYLNGWVVDYRRKPDKRRTVVWQALLYYYYFIIILLLYYYII